MDLRKTPEIFVLADYPLAPNLEREAIIRADRLPGNREVDVFLPEELH